MATRGKIYDKYYGEEIKKGKSPSDAHIAAAERANKEAVSVVRKVMSKEEAKTKSEGVRAKMDAKLAAAEKAKSEREGESLKKEDERKRRTEKLSKMSIEELKELKVKKGK